MESAAFNKPAAQWRKGPINKEADLLIKGETHGEGSGQLWFLLKCTGKALLRGDIGRDLDEKGELAAVAVGPLCTKATWQAGPCA